MTDFEEYREEMDADIQATVTRANCQPVIFAGTGLYTVLRCSQLG